MGAAGATPWAASQAPVALESFPQATIRAGENMIRIATTFRFEPNEIARIKEVAGMPVEVVVCADREEFRKQLREADVVYGSISGADLDFAPRLKWVQYGSAGVESMDEKLRASAIVVTNQARTYAPGISETAMGMLLCLTRGISQYYIPQFNRREWKPVGTTKSDDHVELAGKTMGIIGLGGIGHAVARRAYFGFDMRIVATDAKPLPTPEFVDVLREPAWFREMAAEVDVLAVCAPLTQETRRMCDEKLFRGMKRTAYFLGLSRGELFDDMAIVKALKEGWIAGAGLDVFPQEPPPSNHPIFDCPNVVMTMHTSGWSVQRQIRLVELFAENVRRYAKGLPLLNAVDKARGY